MSAAERFQGHRRGASDVICQFHPTCIMHGCQLASLSVSGLLGLASAKRAGVGAAFAKKVRSRKRPQNEGHFLAQNLGHKL